MKTLEFTAKYRTGTGFITAKTMMVARNITYIQEVPPETPEYKDGMVTTILHAGGMTSSVESYESLSAKYKELMAEEEF